MQGIHSSLSGLQLQTKKLDATSNNIANINTDGYKEKNIVPEEGKNGGVSSTLKTNEEPGPQVVETRSEGDRVVEKSNVNLPGQLVNLIESGRGFEANLKTLKTQDEMLGTLLDIKQ